MPDASSADSSVVLPDPTQARDQRVQQAVRRR